MARVTGAVVRRAGQGDLRALARLRRESSREQDGDPGDPLFEKIFSAWYARESPRGSPGWLKPTGASSGR